MKKIFCIIVIIIVYVTTQRAQGLDIPNIPLEVLVKSPPPVIMLLIDDSTSMNASILANSENNSISPYFYVFNDPENHIITSLISEHTVIPPEKSDSWQARCVSFNQMYYDPHQHYKSWPYWNEIAGLSSDNTNAHMNCPRFHPLKSACLNLDEPYFENESIVLSHAHFFSFDDLNHNDRLDTEETLYLIELSGSQQHICAWRIIDPLSGLKADNIERIKFSQLPDSLRLDTDNEPLSYTFQRQNFANWFSFHRRKEFEIKYQLGHLMDIINEAFVGLYSFNQSLNVSAQFIDQQENTQLSKIALLKTIYSYISEGDSPLRLSYQIIGDYLDTGKQSTINAISPLIQNTDADACRQAYVIVLTDGNYNGPEPDIGNIDGNYPKPYNDSYENTFADVVMYYYERDLARDIPNMVPSSGSDLANHQHLVPLIVLFGSEAIQQYKTISIDHQASWPKPLPEKEQTQLDLLHGAINGRGFFANADNFSEISEVIRQLSLHLHENQSRTSGIVQVGNSIKGNKCLIESFYNPDTWTGDLKAYEIQSDDKKQESSIIWSANEQLEKLSDNNRHLFTFNGHIGISFQENNFDASIISDKQIRTIRNKPLGDIVHSSPLIVEERIWIGSNDGFLHAFDLNTGVEKLAYFPKMFWHHFSELADRDSKHQFYVDGNLYAQKINDQLLLCVALGRGGKGVFCLDITSTNNEMINESEFASKLVKWEYASSDDADLGHVQQAYIVDSNADHQPVVIFGNGYNSERKQAFLYILNALTGQPLKWNRESCKKGIALPAMGKENGLSTPALVDVNFDNTVDFIYAGDLQGNIWKFDCQSENPNEWHVAYENEYDNTKEPLFQAISSAGIVQPITIRPEVIRHCDSRFMGYLVVFGTGKYYEKTDIVNNDTQSLYVIWDWDDYWKSQQNESMSTVNNHYLGSFNTVMDAFPDIRKPNHTPSHITLSRQDIDMIGNTEAIPSVNWDPASDRPHVGWYMDLHSREKIISDLTYLGSNILIFNAFTPDDQSCQSSGMSRMYVVNISTAANLQEVFESMNHSNLLAFSQPISGMLSQPLISFQGRDQMIMYLSSSGLPGISQIVLTLGDNNQLKQIFDRRVFYWKTY